MNYIQMFANGGKTSDQELIKSIQKILGVDDAQMEQLLQIGVNKYGSLEGLGQALNEATQGLTPNSSPEEVQAAVASVFQTNAESQMFKCGGKLQQLVSRFGKGGPVDCGCGGVKLGEDGMKTITNQQRVPKSIISHLESLIDNNPTSTNTASRTITPRDTTDWYPFSNGMVKSVHPTNGNAPTYQVFDGTSLIAPKYSIAPRLENEIGIFARPFQYFGAARRITPEKAQEFETARQAAIPSRQEGGRVIMEAMPGYPVNTNLTRRQARQLAAQNQGYNGEQFNFAMANAKNALRNQGLRGKELRERAREMAAGITPVQRSIVDTPIINTLNVGTPEGFGTVKAIPENVGLPVLRGGWLDANQDKLNTSLTRRLTAPAKRGVVEVGDVSVNGIPSSAVGANSPVTPIKRKGLDGTAVSIDSGVWGIDGTPLGRLYTENIPEQPHVVRSGRDANGNYYEVSDGMAGIDINGNYYIKTITPPKKKTATPATVPAGGGSFSWMSFKCGGKVEVNKCGGKPKAKKAECGVKLKPAMKCGGKTKKK